MTRLSAKDAQALLGQPKRSKMGNKPVWECEDCGFVSNAVPMKVNCFNNRCLSENIIQYASKHEFNRWKELQRLEKAGQIRNLRRQVSYDLIVNGQKICTYRDDASYEEPIGPHRLMAHWKEYKSEVEWQPVVEDSKGYRTAVYKLKKKLMAAGACPEFPQGIDVRET